MVEVNGVKYRRRIETAREYDYTATKMSMIMAMAAVMPFVNEKYERVEMENEQYDNTMLPREYEKVLNKQSRFSANQRAQIVNRFERKYERVEDDLQD